MSELFPQHFGPEQPQLAPGVPAYGSSEAFGLTLVNGSPGEQVPVAPETAAQVEARLMNLGHEGFLNDEQWLDTAGKIAAIGLPADNYSKLHPVPGVRGIENASTNGDNSGRPATPEQSNSQVPEKQLGAMVGEAMHANTPLDRANAHLYASESDPTGETTRAAAESTVRRIADQSLLTGKYLSGYHKRLAKQLEVGQITHDAFVEETQAIAGQLAMTNRQHLDQVQSAQHAKLDRLQRAGNLPQDAQPPVYLLSRPGKDGQVITDGIDKQLVTLTRGVNNHTDLITHIGGLKARFYRQSSLEVSNQRWTAQLQEAQHLLFIAQMEGVIQDARERRTRRERQKRHNKDAQGEGDDDEEGDDDADGAIPTPLIAA